MNILFLDQFGAIGGGQRCLLDLLPGVVRRRWRAIVAAPPDGPLLDAARAAGADTVPLCLGRYCYGTKSASDALRFTIALPRLAREIARMSADLIYVNGPRLLPAAALGAHGRPVIFHAHHFLLSDSAKKVAGWAIRQVRATVIANSRHVANQFAGSTAPHVIYNGVESIPFAPRNFGAGGEWKIGILGRIAPMKGQTDFLRAARIVAQQRPEVRFVICGEQRFGDSDYATEVQRLAQGLPVEFTGWRDDIACVLHGLDLLAVPSSAAEATTRVILEAFAAGVPVVAHAIGGIPEVVQDNRTGFLVKPCQPPALAAKILEAIRLDLSAVAQRARASWEHRYTVERWREDVLRIIEQSRGEQSRGAIRSLQRIADHSVGARSRA